MKQIKIVVVLFLLSANSFAFSGSSFHKKAADIYLPIGNNMQISLLDLSVIKEHDFEKISGKHLNFFERLGFKASQKKLRNSINADGTINNKKLSRYLEEGDHSTGFHLGGFALGFLVGLIGVLIAYLINDDNKRNRVKWAWIGFGISVVLYIALVVIVLSNSGIY